MEPRASTPARRLQALDMLSAAGVPTAVMFAPVIPALNDQEMENVLQAAANAGALEAGEPGEIHGALGLARALQHTARRRAEREDVAWADDVLGLGDRVGVRVGEDIDDRARLHEATA